MIKTNKDTCSYMETLELSVFRDEDHGRMTFEDHFTLIGKHRSYNMYYYSPCCGEDVNIPISNSDLYDFSKVTRKDFRKFCLEKSPENCSAEDVVMEKVRNYRTWEDYALAILNEESIISAFKNDNINAINNAEMLYDYVSASGFSQGDYCLVLFKKSDFESTTGLHEMFSNMIYNQIVCVKLTVDGEEHFLEEGLSDMYQYDKDEILTHARSLNLKESTVEWLEENLPDCA